MRSVRGHYDDVATQLAQPDRVPEGKRPGNQHMTILVSRVDEVAARAISYARAVGPADISAVTFDDATVAPWNELASDIPLDKLTRNGSQTASLRRYLRDKRTRLAEGDFLTLIVPEQLRSAGMLEIVTRPAMHRLKAAFLREPGIQVLDIPVLEDRRKSSSVDLAAALHGPTRHLVCILVSNVHNATLQAVEYAETLQATDIRAVSFVLDPAESQRIANDWLDARIPHPLEIEDSPFRDIGRSLRSYVRQFEPDGINRLVTVVIPEYILSKRWHQFLHGQTALIIKRHLLFEPGVVVVSVPYHLTEKDENGPWH
jgi:hypothetical protein